MEAEAIHRGEDTQKADWTFVKEANASIGAKSNGINKFETKVKAESELAGTKEAKEANPRKEKGVWCYPGQGSTLLECGPPALIATLP